MPEDVFTLSGDVKLAAEIGKTTLLDQAILQAYVLYAHDITQRQAVSTVANMLVDVAWNIAKREREAAGEEADPEQFMRMVKDHVNK